MHRVYHRRMLATNERISACFGANRPAREVMPRITVSREMISMTRGLLPVSTSTTAYQRYHLAKNARGIWHAYRTDGYALARVLVASSLSQQQQWELQIDDAGYPIDDDQVLLSPTLISSFDAPYCVPMTAKTVDGNLYLHGNCVNAKPSTWSPPLTARHGETFRRALKWLGGAGIEVGIGAENGVLRLNQIALRRIDGTRAVLVALRRVGA